ncbi:MAG: deoxycytidylate deaminase, partial [Acholeplasmataceae bacterium]
RSDYLSWDEYFMGVAKLSAMRSKDPVTQVGACIVNSDKRIIGIGYNGFPMGCSDDLFPWSCEGKTAETKYPYVVHAEANAILNATMTLKGATIYVTLFPCHECVKLIIQSGIRTIIYETNKETKSTIHEAALRMLEAAEVSHRMIRTGRLSYASVS